MRTTIDIPEDLLRRTKATAALRGMKLKDLVSMLLEQGLARQAGTIDSTVGPLPTAAELEARLLEQDVARVSKT